MRSIENKYIGSTMMARGHKKVYLSNAITEIIESKLKEPCGAVMINGTESIFKIECRYYDSLVMFTIFTKDRVIESIKCDLSDDWKEQLFGDQDIVELLNSLFVNSSLANGYTSNGESTRFDTSYYRNKSQVEDKLTGFVTYSGLYESVLDVFNS